MTDMVNQPAGGPEAEPSPPEQPSGWMDRVTGAGTRLGRSLLVPSLALLSALVVGAIIIMFTNLDAIGRLGSEPGAALVDMLDGVRVAYWALLTGAFGSVRAISETLFASTPLILTGLAVAIGFRTGLFNIGARGQMFIGGMAALWVGIHWSMPAFLHIPVAILAAIIGGAIWGGIAGLLKARTGAHEVITTIMLNFVAAFLTLWALKTSLFQEAGSNQPLSAPIRESARLPGLFGSDYRVSIGFFFAIAAVFFVMWLLFKSTLGFEFRAAGFNPTASRYAGMNVAWLYTSVMAISGALAGIAGATMTIGLPPYQTTSGFAGMIGFDAIALALLGRSHPIGVLWAGFLFGALQAGGRAMQGVARVSLDLVVVMQGLIIVFIAAPELVRAIFRVKPPEEEVTRVTRGWSA